MLQKFWAFEIQLLPVLLTLLLFEAPNLYRKINKIYYVPIYFSVFPLSQMNDSLSKYLVEDFFGENITENSAKLLRNRIIFISGVSAIVSIFIIPCVVGFISSFYLNDKTLMQFLVCLGMYKSVTVVLSIINFHKHSIATAKNRLFLAVIYFFYVGIVLRAFKQVFLWTQPYVISKNWSSLLDGLGNFIFGQVGYGIVFLLLSVVFTSMVADRNVRIENINKIKSQTSEQGL